MPVFGVDYAWGRPGAAALKKAGVRFACRYLSHDTTGKNLTPAEARQLSDAGIWVVVVWEATASRALAGQVAGAADARAAAVQAAACGMPDDRPIYFAADWDASQAQQAAINAYLDGAASVLGKDRTGLYGGYGPVKRALDGGHCAWAWQTYAWSGGRWDSRAQLQQYSNDHTINGVGLDFDRATTDDFGQWKVGESPMALTADDIEKIRKAVWESDKAPVPPGVTPGTNPTWQYINLMRETYGRVLETKGLVAAIAAQADDVDEAAIVKGVLAGLAPGVIAAAVVEALPPDLASQVVDELKARLES